MERSTQYQKLRGEYVTPQNRCEGHSFHFSFWEVKWKKKKQTRPSCSITRERLMIMYINCFMHFFFCTAILFLPFSTTYFFYSPPPLFLSVTLHTSQSFTRQSYLTLITLLKFVLWQIAEGRFTAIFSHSHPGTKHFKTCWKEWNTLEYLGSRLGCFKSQIKLPDHWSNMNSLPKLPTTHNGHGQVGQQSPPTID